MAMQSEFLAQVFGIYMIIMGFAMMFRAGEMKGMIDDMLKSPALTMVGGTIALVLGLLLVLSHNMWVQSWEVIITILSWATLLKGATIVLCGTKLITMFKGMYQKTGLLYSLSVLWIILGGVLAYFGFFA